LKQRNIVRYIKAQRLAWLGHLKRMHEERIKKITRWKPLSSRPKWQPKKKWDVLQDLQIMKIKSWKMCVWRKEQHKEIPSDPNSLRSILLSSKRYCRISLSDICIFTQYMNIGWRYTH
jgi:hypothetical protein